MPETSTLDDAVAGLYAADPNRDYIVVSHAVSRQLHYKLSSLIASKQRNKACTLFLTTYGGDPNGGYRIGRCLRHHYTQNIRLVVPSFCKSAGTLVAIAADELGIGDFGELGPLDIQVRKASELEESSSGLDIMQALQAVTLHTQVTFHRMLMESRGLGLSTKLCSEFAGQVVSGIAAPLFSQIDPIRLGEMQRAMRVAFEYGSRLDKYGQNLKDGALVRLINNYPAHGFVIDRKEASELFERVSHLTDAEKMFCNAVWESVGSQTDIDPVMVETAQQSNQTGTDDENPDAKVDDGLGTETSGKAESETRVGQRGGNGKKNAPRPDGQGLRVRADGVARSG